MGPQQGRLFKYKWVEEGGGVARGGNREERQETEMGAGEEEEQEEKEGRGEKRKIEREKEKKNQVPYLLIHSNSQIFCFPDSNT